MNETQVDPNQLQQPESASAISRCKYSIHGQGVDLSTHLESLTTAIDRTLGQFAVRSLSGNNSRNAPIRGLIRPFDERDVLRYLSPTATRIAASNDLVELYEEGERFWLIDDHWGLCEINILKGIWRSWVLPAASADPMHIVEHAVLWPIAQLLRMRGLCIIPAAGVVRDGWGALLLSSFNIEPELTALVHAGYRVVGQSWVAIREEEGRIVMLHMPGSLQRATAPRPPGSSAPAPTTSRVDLTSEFLGSRCDQAVCDAVLLVASGRRPLSHIRSVPAANVVTALRHSWPITELHPQRRHGQLPIRIAQKCKLFDVQLSRNPNEVLTLLDTALADRTRASNAPALGLGRSTPDAKVVA